MLQKLDHVIATITNLVAETNIEQVTMIDSKAPSLTSDTSLPIKAISSLEQIKHLFGVDLGETLKSAQPRLAVPTRPLPSPTRNNGT